jgi:SAM-dependent methyltransferase
MTTEAGSDEWTPTSSAAWKSNPTPKEQSALNAYLQETFASPFIQETTARKISLLNLAAGQSIIDVGCGSGVLLPMLAKAVGSAGKVVGVDYSPAMVRDAEKKVETEGLSQIVSVREADARRLPFADRSFDAAHCERLLMHLEDPNTALTEMVRVVRPGGRIVVAEPDWSGFRIDHPDRADFDAIYHRAMPMRHPDMGLTVLRRMQEIGLTDVTAQPVLGVFRDAGVLLAAGLRLSLGADALVEEGKISRSRADALIAKLDELNSAGRYLAVGVYYVVAARTSQ